MEAAEKGDGPLAPLPCNTDQKKNILLLVSVKDETTNSVNLHFFVPGNPCVWSLSVQHILLVDRLKNILEQLPTCLASWEVRLQEATRPINSIGYGTISRALADLSNQLSELSSEFQISGRKIPELWEVEELAVSFVDFSSSGSSAVPEDGDDKFAAPVASLSNTSKRARQIETAATSIYNIRLCLDRLLTGAAEEREDHLAHLLHQSSKALMICEAFHRAGETALLQHRLSTTFALSKLVLPPATATIVQNSSHALQKAYRLAKTKMTSAANLYDDDGIKESPTKRIRPGTPDTE